MFRKTEIFILNIQFMRRQTFANHVRYYTPHHFVFYPLLLVAITLSLRAYVMRGTTAFVAGDNRIAHFYRMVIFYDAATLCPGNQNRIIRLELRFRYYVLPAKDWNSGRRAESFTNGSAAFCVRRRIARSGKPD